MFFLSSELFLSGMLLFLGCASAMAVWFVSFSLIFTIKSPAFNKWSYLFIWVVIGISSSCLIIFMKTLANFFFLEFASSIFLFTGLAISGPIFFFFKLLSKRRG
jgi:hypothetical protein